MTSEHKRIIFVVELKLKIMKKVILIGFIVVISQLGYSQTGFIHSDSVDRVALNYLNMYRAYYNLPKVLLDTTLKNTCTEWAEVVADSCHIKVGHSKPTLPYGELVVGSAICGNKINDTTSNFALFVKNITGKKIINLTGTDIVILETLFSWENSPNHKKWLTNKNVKKVYYSIYYKVNRPKELIYASPNDQESKNFGDWGYSDRGNQVRMSFGSVIQFRQ